MSVNKLALAVAGGSGIGVVATAYADAFPLAPLGGLFLIGAGLGVMGGAAYRKRRVLLTWCGFAAGGSALYFCSGFLSKGTHAATVNQVAWLIAAIIIESAAFAIIAPRARRRGERDEALSTLFIVGIHFLIMIPAFGFLIGCLALSCISNACLCTWKPAYPFLRAWLIDGALKVSFGSAMLLSAPVFASYHP